MKADKQGDREAHGDGKVETNTCGNHKYIARCNKRLATVEDRATTKVGIEEKEQRHIQK